MGAEQAISHFSFIERSSSNYLLDNIEIGFLQCRVAHDDGLDVAFPDDVRDVRFHFRPRRRMYRESL